MFDLKNINKNWTLFIDRDGVINHEKQGGYIENKSEFLFYPDVKNSFQKLKNIFGRVIVVTNQRGVGRGLMTEKDLQSIHSFMLHEIEEAGGHIDAIYFCTATDGTHPNRKPNPGMALQAAKDFPAIEFDKSIMVGNKLSDMEFGRNAGMFTVFLATTHPETPMPHPAIDFRYASLPDFVKAL